MDKELLTASRIDGADRHGEVEIPGVGTITVRGLSRHEYIRGQQYAEDLLQQERYLLSRCMIDPVMTEADVAAWQKGSDPQEINLVSLKVNELSGIGKGADKSAVAEV